MNDLRPKPEQPKEQVAPSVVREPSTTSIPAQPSVTPPKGPAPVSTQPKP